jgi:hypothetical protein
MMKLDSARVLSAYDNEQLNGYLEDFLAKLRPGDYPRVTPIGVHETGGVGVKSLLLEVRRIA